MPYDSTTAYGALHDNLASYAQAFQLLLEQAGIPCVTVSGQLGAENHMWTWPGSTGSGSTSTPPAPGAGPPTASSAWAWRPGA